MKDSENDQLFASKSTLPTWDAARSEAVTDLARQAIARLCETKASRPAYTGAANLPGTAELMRDPVASALAYSLCDEEPDIAQAIIEDLLEAGVSVEDICLDHLAPAARRLGEWWTEDRVAFTDVTLATARMQSMMLRLPASRVAPRCNTGHGALFAAVPGEQHTLGVMIAADLFRRNGWDVGLLIGLDHTELVDRVSRDDRPVIGLSCGGDHTYPALRRLMAAIRRNRPDAQILLSGQIVTNPDRIEDLPGMFTIVADTSEAERIMGDLARDLGAATTRGLSA